MITFLQLSEYQDSDARLKVINFAKKSNPTKIKFPVESLKMSFNLEINHNEQQVLEFWEN